MQPNSSPRSNSQRTARTRAALIEAARKLFITNGYAATSTPDVVFAAGVTRGALYHHFADKQALFRAVVEQEAGAVAEHIDKATPNSLTPRRALLRGGDAFLEAMSVVGRTRLLLLDGPAVLGRAGMDAIDDANGARTLREGLSAAMTAGTMPGLAVDALAAVLSASFDRAALDIDSGGRPEDYRKALAELVNGLLTRQPL